MVSKSILTKSLLALAGGIIVYGMADAYIVMPRREPRKTNTAATTDNANDKYTTPLSREDNELLDKFGKLSCADQEALFQTLEARVNREAGIDAFCNEILSNVPADARITLEQLSTQVAQYPELEKGLEKVKEKYPQARVYCLELNKIFIPEPAYTKAVKQILEYRETPKVVEAHEGLHFIQAKATTNAEIYRKVWGQFRKEGENLNEEFVKEFSKEFFEKECKTETEVQTARARVIQGYAEFRARTAKGSLLREMQARMIWPKVTENGIALPRDVQNSILMDAETAAMYNPALRQPLMNCIMAAYGRFANQGAAVDIQVAKWVGRWTGDEEQMLRNVQSDPDCAIYIRKGQSLLRARTEQLDKAPDIARKVLRGYLQRN